MSVAQQVFVVFYAIFWGTQANVLGRWKMFNWPLCRYRPVRHRCLLSLAVMNVGQVLMFLFFLYHLRDVSHAAFGVLPAFGVFGWYRVWLAIVEYKPERFYFHIERDREKIAVSPLIEPRFSESYQPDDPNCLTLGQFSCGNFITAICYFAFAGGSVYVAQWFV